MKTSILYLFTRTPLHVGAGSSVGAVDQPIQRERHTGFPIIPGSSIKGVIRDHIESQDGWDNEDVIRLFGVASDTSTSRSGIASFGEARVLAFPVRSAIGAYALITCPLALSRFRRDAQLPFFVPDEPEDMTGLSGDAVSSNDRLVLEEYAFKQNGPFPLDWAEALSGCISDAILMNSKPHFVLLSNGDFAHFVLSTCPVSQHVGIDDKTGTAAKGALYNEETVPSETLFYSVVIGKPLGRESQDDVETLKKFNELLGNEILLQFGGNNTAGLGFTTGKIVQEKDPS